MLSEISKSTIISNLYFIILHNFSGDKSRMHNFLVQKIMVCVSIMKIIGYKAIHAGNTLDSRRIQMRTDATYETHHNQVIESFD